MSFGPPPSVYTQSAVSAEAARAKRRRRMLLWPTAVVLVVALGTAGWLLWGGDSGSEPAPGATAAQGRLDVRESVEKPPAGTVGRMAFRFSVEDMGPGEHYEMPGIWATDKILAKGVNKTVVGLTIGTDAAPGDEKWKLPLDGPICGYTRHVAGENRTAVLYRATTSPSSTSTTAAGSGRATSPSPATPTPRAYPGPATARTPRASPSPTARSS